MPVDTISQPLTSQAILALVAALGLSSTAGLRAVATLFAIGAVSDITISGKPLLELNGSFKVLGSTPVLILLGVLTIVEIVIDKFPVLDHVNDVIHTVVRPVVGGVILAGTANSLSDTNVWVAAAVGAALAFGVHATKATTRVASTATTAGVANPILSTGEDVLAIVAIILVVVAKSIAILVSPVLGVILLVIVIILALALVFAAWRITTAIYGLFRGKPATQAARTSAGQVALSGDAPRGLND